MGNQVTKAALDALFADNEIGAITPARLRDFVESVLASRGTLTFASSATVIAAASTPTKAGNVTTLEHAYRFSMPANNRLQYDGAEDVEAELLVVVGLSVADDAQAVRLSLAVNGAEVAATRHTFVSGAADTLQQASLLANVDLSDGDYVELFVSNETSGADITVDHGRVRAVAFLT